MSNNKKSNETKEYGELDGVKKMVDEIKSILDTHNGEIKAILDTHNGEIKAILDTHNEKLKLKISEMDIVDSPSPPVDLCEISLDEAEDKIRSVSEAYDKVWYDKSGGDPEKRRKILKQLRKKKREWEDFVEKINIQETNEAANDDPYMANVLKIIRGGKECVLCGKKGACSKGDMNYVSANRFHKCHSCGNSCNGTIYMCSGNGKKDGRCGFFHCKTPGLGCLVQIAEYRKQNEGGETLKWH